MGCETQNHMERSELGQFLGQNLGADAPKGGFGYRNEYISGDPSLSPLHSAECRGSCLPDGTIWKFSDSLQLVQNALCWQELRGVEGAILGTAAASGNKGKVSPHATLPPLQWD